MATQEFITRFAPSPTGYLHLGHVVNALYVWAMAEKMHAKVILRMEDHDQTRCKKVFEEAILQDLEWLGLKPDQGLPSEFRKGKCDYRQTDSTAHYQNALAELKSRGLVYSCDCSRQRIRERVTQPDSDELKYDGHCRERNLPFEKGFALRIRLPEDQVEFEDLICGHQQQHPASQCGDIVALDRNGNWTYQFAVVVDDIRHGVNLVIRGQDLLSSTGRQILLQRLLGQPNPPVYAHHDLLMAPDGRKLSKKDFSEDIHSRCQKGEAAENVIGEATLMANFQTNNQPLTIAEALMRVSQQIESITQQGNPT